MSDKYDIDDKDDLDLLTLVGDLKELKGKVMLFGLSLKVPKERIEVIEKEHKGCDRIFIEVLDFWLKNCVGDRRKCLCEAVGHVDNTTLKDKIQQKYGENDPNEVEPSLKRRRVMAPLPIEDPNEIEPSLKRQKVMAPLPIEDDPTSQGCLEAAVKFMFKNMMCTGYRTKRYDDIADSQ